MYKDNAILHDEQLSYHAWNVLALMTSIAFEAKQAMQVFIKYNAPYTFSAEQLMRRKCELLGVVRGTLWLDSTSLTYEEYTYLHDYYLRAVNELHFFIDDYLERHL